MSQAKLKLNYPRSIYEAAHIIDGIIGMKKPHYKPFFSSGLFGGEYGLEVVGKSMQYILIFTKDDSKRLKESGGLFGIEKLTASEFIITSDTLSKEIIQKVKEELAKKY